MISMQEMKQVNIELKLQLYLTKKQTFTRCVQWLLQHLLILDEFGYRWTTNTLTLFLHKGLCLYSYTAKQQNENRFIRADGQAEK